MYKMLKVYWENRYISFLILIVISLLFSIASILEVFSGLALNEATAFSLYLSTALIRSVMMFSLGLFFILLSEEKIKYLSISMISVFATIEIWETIKNPFIVKKAGGSWVVLTVRSPIAYISRTMLLTLAFIVFSFYTYRFLKRTRNPNRKFYTHAIILGLILMLFFDGANYIYSYPIIDQNISALVEFYMTTSLLAIGLLDPFLYLFFMGEVKSILIYRSDGVLLAEYNVQEEKTEIDNILLGNLLSAIVYLGMETFFYEKVDYIRFEGNLMIIENYKNLYATIIGKNIHLGIRRHLKKFLKEFYNTFKNNIESEVIVIPNKEKTEKLFKEILEPIIM